MKITPGSLIVDIGEAAWRKVAPWKRLKRARNRWRERRGLPPIPITDEDDKMLPQGKATYTGAALGAVSPFIGFVVAALSPPLENAIVALNIAPAMCAIEDTSCVTAGMMAVAVATGVLTSVASWLVAWGRRRAERRHEAELSAAKGG